MACDQYTPSSWFLPNSSQSDFTSNFTLGSYNWPLISWWGGTPYLLNQKQNWRLLLGWSSDNNAESALSNGHSKEMTTGTEGWDFTYGYGGNPSWVMPSGDTCGYTALVLSWEMGDIDISSNQKFKIFAMNQTDPEAITTKTSPGFLLLPSTVSSTSSSVLTTASQSSSDTLQALPTLSDNHITITPTAASTNSASPGPKPIDLSTGAKAGIGVGCTFFACSILFGVLLFFLRRRRQQPAYKSGPFSFRKPELDGKAAAEKHELDEQHGTSEMMEPRITTPVEIPGDFYRDAQIPRLDIRDVMASTTR